VWLVGGLAAVGAYVLGPSTIVGTLLFDGLSLGAFVAVSGGARRTVSSGSPRWFVG
jgi:hypothetical protein